MDLRVFKEFIQVFTCKFIILVFTLESVFTVFTFEGVFKIYFIYIEGVVNLLYCTNGSMLFTLILCLDCLVVYVLNMRDFVMRGISLRDIVMREFIC